MENKYYIEIQNKIEYLINEFKNEEALILIKKELSMPYIPLKFEDFLLKSLEKIPIIGKNDSFTFSLEKIIDLLLKLDKNNNDFSDLISQLTKFNLKNEKNELEYYFSKSKNKRNRAMIFELLIKEKVNLECEYGNPSKLKPVTESENYLFDKAKLKNVLDKNPSLLITALKLLDEIYLTTYIGQKLDGEYWEIVIFTIFKIFQDKELLTFIEDYEKMRTKLEKFKSFDNI